MDSVSLLHTNFARPVNRLPLVWMASDEEVVLDDVVVLDVGAIEVDCAL